MDPSKLFRTLLTLAAILLALATTLGAYARHGLEGSLDPAALGSFETAVDYQFFHALGLFGLALLIDRRPGARLLQLAALLIVLGITLFCGGLYATSLDGPGWVSRLAPTGGTALIAGWLVCAFAAFKRDKRDG